MKISLITSKDRWFKKFLPKLKKKIQNKGHKVKIIYNIKNLVNCDLTFLVSCGKILKKKHLSKSKLNLTLHASNLPKDKGSSPIAWQIIRGDNKIYISF